METKEFLFKGFKMNGFAMLFLHLVVFTAVIVACFVVGGTMLYVAGGVLTLVWFILLAGYMQLEPNEARAMVFFGQYRGTFKETGFYWVNPFYDKKKLSLRARNLDVEPIKVNDKVGNPILIGLVLVWKLRDTYKAMFEIDSQTMASAQVAGQYAYDDNEGEAGELTLRSGGEEINEQLERELNERLVMAGLEVVEARINYLAYAPEIAAVMLRRQQASAIIGAREKIVEGAVSMVHMALEKLEKDNVVDLDEDKKAAMVSNLLVVLCADESAQPVLNTGTLNH